MADGDRRFIAYEIHEPRDMPVVRAPFHRDWMDATDQQFAYRCLPLVIANQSGWLVPNPTEFIARWNGGPAKSDLVLDFAAPPSSEDGTFRVDVAATGPAREDARILSHFGTGILTFTLPYLFRTPPGINLWVKGPANCVKDGACPLEGVVESDWSAATFTMNWKLTRPGLPVRFARGEPICMIVPVPRGLAESLDPRQVPLRSNPELESAYQAWQSGRLQFNRALADRAAEAVERGWQKDYFQGRDATGSRVVDHQTTVKLKDFIREPG